MPTSVPSALYQLAQRSPVQELLWSSAQAANCRIWVKRDDLLHPAVSGNKLFKLFHHLSQAKKTAASGLISFGGAYSNHLFALARVAQLLKFPSLAVIRGTDADLDNPTLKMLRVAGMQLLPVSHERYRNKMQPEYLAELAERYANYYLIPEGGAGILGAQGFADYAKAVNAQLTEQDIKIDCVWLPAGTGTSVAGLASTWQNVHAVGAIALQNNQSFTQSIADLARRLSNAPCGPAINWHGFETRFGRITPSIVECCRDFWCQTGVLFDPIYGGKLLMALKKAFTQGLRNQNILIVHTGGNQGWQATLQRPDIDGQVLQDAFNQYFHESPSFILHDAELTLGLAVGTNN